MKTVQVAYGIPVSIITDGETNSHGETIPVRIEALTGESTDNPASLLDNVLDAIDEICGKQNVVMCLSDYWTEYGEGYSMKFIFE